MSRNKGSLVGRSLAIALLVATSAVGLSCDVNDYCLNCPENGDGGGSGDGDGGVDDATDGGGSGDPDAQDAGPCIATGAEICDGLDNDCNGMKDDGLTLTQNCDQDGECAGAVKECIGGEEKCSKAPAPESCDGKDNDCDGTPDDGDPQGGAKCGTDLGECRAGTMHCNTATGMLECQGSVGMPGAVTESCNGKDDDCDGMFDENMQNLGQCGQTDMGECSFGTRKCIGGGIQCVGEQGPTPELCDMADQDCDGNPTNGYNLNSDPRNCGACGNVCNLDFANEGCGGNPPACTVVSCEPGHVDFDGNPANGCEYACSFNGAETCNGRDDDCDRDTDEDVVAPANLCLTAGECATNRTVTCQGMAGWRCNYNDPDVSKDANGNIIPETRCDQKDNDCDGTVDDAQPNVGQACDNGQVGDCRSSGTMICNPANLNGPAICQFTQTGPGSSTETCDGRDNNCNGTIDDGAAAGTIATGQDFVTIPGSTVRIMKYEASRPNATATSVGTLQTHVCSRPDVQPWTNITYPQAVAACQSIGARLCTEFEWQQMCSQPTTPTFPVAAPTAAASPVVIEAENALRVTNNPFQWVVESPARPGSSGGSNMIADDTNDGITNHDSVSLTFADNDAPYLHFSMSFAATSYYVWVRIMAEDLGATPNTPAYDPDRNSEVHIGISATAGAQPTQSVDANPDAFPNGDTHPTAGTWRWMVAGPFSVTAGTRNVNVFMGEDEVRLDAIAVSLDGTNPPAYDARIWAYGTNPKTLQPQTCNGDEFDTNTTLSGDQDDILATATLPQCFANGPGAADAFDMSGNVKEWTQARAANQNPLRGGSANNEAGGLACGLNFTLADDQFFFPNVGFRCCK